MQQVYHKLQAKGYQRVYEKSISSFALTILYPEGYDMKLSATESVYTGLPI